MKLIEFCNQYWYKLKDKVDYDWDRYWDWNASVTSILKMIIDPKFDFILNKYKDQCEKSAFIWKQEHSNVELFFKPKSGVDKMNNNFMKFITLYNIKPIYQEKTYIKDWVRWTIDMIADVNYYDLKWTYNIDWKNTNKQSKKYELQLNAYKRLNWYDWILVYWKSNLQIIKVSDYMEVWLELLNYFLTKRLWH